MEKYSQKEYRQKIGNSESNVKENSAEKSIRGEIPIEEEEVISIFFLSPYFVLFEQGQYPEKKILLGTSVHVQEIPNILFDSVQCSNNISSLNCKMTD